MVLTAAAHPFVEAGAKVMVTGEHCSTLKRAPSVMMVKDTCGAPLVDDGIPLTAVIGGNFCGT